MYSTYSHIFCFIVYIPFQFKGEEPAKKKKKTVPAKKKTTVPTKKTIEERDKYIDSAIMSEKGNYIMYTLLYLA